MKENTTKHSAKALIPFAVFVISYLGIAMSLVASGEENGFYGFKSPLAVIIGIVSAFIILDGDIESKFTSLIKGCGDENIIIMCIIYLLAGGFAAVSKKMGAVESTVNLGMTLIPSRFITAGIFIIASFLSLATGTSVGTISTMGPIAIGFCEKAGLSMSLVIAALVGGAMFGDNLSIISDTTIAATRTQNVSMKDKFRVNFSMALPAAIITVILLLIFSKTPDIIEIPDNSYSIIKVIPYIFVLVSAISGLNVFLVLFGGIVLSSCIGVFYGDFGLLESTNIVYDGFAGMFEIFLLSMLTGGLASMVTKAGGIDYLLYRISSKIKTKRSAEAGIALMALITDMATANNTVAIIIDGKIAREISVKYKVDPRKTASLLDVFSCVMQGIIPYGAQLLIALGFTNGALGPMDIIPLLWYQMILAFFAILSIYTPLFNRYINKVGWDFENWCDIR